MSRQARGIYGYAVESEFALERLRAIERPRGRIVITQGSDRLLDDPADLMTVVEDDSGEAFAFALARGEGALLAWCALTGDYRIEAEAGRIWAQAIGPAPVCEDRLLNALIPTLLIERGELMLHAASVMTEAGAVIVCGPSGRGKSSLVAALGEQGYRVLAEDALALSSEAGRWQLWPGPTGVRLDARTASALGAEITDTQLIRGKQVHVPRLSPDDGAAADVAAVVRLEPRDGAGLTVQGVRESEAMAAVFPSVFRIELDGVPSAFRQVGELVRQVPCFTARLPDDLGRLPEISLALVSRLGAVRPGIRAA